MDLKEVFEIAAKTGEFPTVEVEKPFKHFTSTKGKIVQIKPNGVSVDFGGAYNVWFHSKIGKDKRSKYMYELKATN